MSVHFFVPDQQDAWSRINRDLMASRGGYSSEVLDGMWGTGQMGIHEMATDEGPFGYLVLMKLNLGLGPFLHVMWCEVRPTRALRGDLDWLQYAAEYLRSVAAFTGCESVRIAVAENHPSPSWKWRLERVGFKPLNTELALRVAA